MSRRACLPLLSRLLLLLIAIGTATSGWPGPAAAERERSEPRVFVPGDQAVLAGQLVELRWSRAEAISELEILLSTDGGRTYPRCISPELDPSRCSFVWRVPPDLKSGLRLRIRYNRGGREIEGPPTRSVALGTPSGGDELPFGLPPAPPSDESGRPSRAVGQATALLEAPDELPAASLRARHDPIPAPSRVVRLSSPPQRPFSSRTFTPLRT